MISYVNTGQYKAMFIRYNQFNNYWQNTHSNNRNNHIFDQFENGEMVILIQKIDDNSEKQTFILNINAANQTFNRDGQDLGLFFGEDPFLPKITTQKARQFITEMNGFNGEPFVYLIFADRCI